MKEENSKKINLEGTCIDEPSIDIIKKYTLSYGKAATDITIFYDKIKAVWKWTCKTTDNLYL